ncbi:ABC transporter ATP-binding protein [Paenibacillus sp. LHD-117]|uniref:ABC transporter ATP-binding protein n=1 Tax=Paenibacillus sp. LHD-117 TaxID=3071412 RepID=UPI0027DF9CBD|nr:ABC transporter ATP-binding protein [Paenibacillus sp. LHD-117]MDQ6421095.1 ABC transporter ATP-binding protein [Paenibacillus sp. LHD-117]
MVIDIQNISWERGDETILSGMNWQVKRGEHWCLLGLNGSGKTTLLNMINGYIWPTTGKISVLGHAFGEYDLRELRKRIGWVSTSLQQKLYGSGEALQIVLSGKHSTIGVYDELQESDLDRARSLMQSLGCERLMNRAYQTLSQGERQRVLIARALMNNPELLILDEPCTGLDIFAREQLLSMIGTIAGEENPPTLIYVTHHVEEILPCFGHSLLIKQGKVFAADRTEELMSPERMSEFLDVPVHIERMNGRYWLSVKST